MRRREFITVLGGAAATWPLPARAQQSEQMRRIGVLQGGADTDDPRSQPNIAAFLQTLQQLGWADGRNVKIDYRWPAGDADKARKYSAELVALAPDIILAFSTPFLVSLLQATRTVPLLRTRLRRRRRPDFLWARCGRPVPARGRLCRSHPQGREAGRPPGAGADQIRAGDQSQDRQGTGSHNSAGSARPRRRGDRVRAPMSASGTKRTWADRSTICA
jgi:hypothetical protein